jgi:glycosyltransferase involved in cell wall biosynthesis
MATEPVRVLRIVARLNAGGPAHHVGLLSSRLDARGYKSVLVHGRVSPGEAPLARFDERYPSHRIELPALGREPRPHHDVVCAWYLARLIRRFRPQIVHTHTAKAGVLGRLAALSVVPRPRLVHTFHGHVFHGYFGPRKSGAYRRLEQVLGRVSDRILAVSGATAADLTRLRVAAPEKIRILRLGLDLDPFLRSGIDDGHRFRAELGVLDDELLAITVGRLVGVKRLDRALEAVAAARAQGARVRLAVVGDGPLRPRLEEHARRLGLDGQVSFLGYRDDLVSITAAADVALLTSDNEGTPVSLIEAGASAKPAVATNVGGVREVVPPGAGLVVAPGDIDGLSEALRLLAADPELRRRLGSTARRHTAQVYTAERLLDDMDELYRELLAP